MITAHQLAQEATIIQITKNDYNENLQVRFGNEDCATALTITFNGTQTYAANGKPFDADNDA